MDERVRRAGRHVAASIRRFWRPTLNTALVFILVQVIYSQSRSARSAWMRAKRHMPDPVLDAGDAVAETAVGRAVGHVTAGVHAGANWVFRPFRATVAAQETRGREAGEAAAEFRRRLEDLERATPRGPERVIGGDTAP